MSVKLLYDCEVCDDCACAIANDDYTGLDYYLSEPASTRRMEHIKACIADMGGYPVIGDATGFSSSRCDCCGAMAGDLHECSVLSE